MEELDGDDIRVSYNGKEASRDIVQVSALLLPCKLSTNSFTLDCLFQIEYLKCIFMLLFNSLLGSPSIVFLPVIHVYYICSSCRSETFKTRENTMMQRVERGWPRKYSQNYLDSLKNSWG